MQESLQQQVEQVSSLLEDQHKLPATLIHQATDPQVWQQVYDGQILLWTFRIKLPVDHSKQVVSLEVVCLLDVQGELDRALGGVCSHPEQMKSSVDLQRQYERLVRSLEELLALGCERLALQPEAELHNRAQLQQQYSSHTVSLWEEKSLEKEKKKKEA